MSQSRKDPQRNIFCCFNYCRTTQPQPPKRTPQDHWRFNSSPRRPSYSRESDDSRMLIRTSETRAVITKRDSFISTHKTALPMNIQLPTVTSPLRQRRFSGVPTDGSKQRRMSSLIRTRLPYSPTELMSKRSLSRVLSSNSHRRRMSERLNPAAMPNPLLKPAE